MTKSGRGRAVLSSLYLSRYIYIYMFDCTLVCLRSLFWHHEARHKLLSIAVRRQVNWFEVNALCEWTNLAGTWWVAFYTRLVSSINPRNEHYVPHAFWTTWTHQRPRPGRDGIKKWRGGGARSTGWPWLTRCWGWGWGGALGGPYATRAHINETMVSERHLAARQRVIELAILNVTAFALTVIGHPFKLRCDNVN